MKRPITLLLTTLIPLLGAPLTTCASDYQLDLENGPKLAERGPRLVINNRPLAKVNGKIISLFDVVKKLDLFLYNYDPDYVPPVAEKYQFYQSRWQQTLDDMIIDELVLLDAEKKEISISEGEVRQEMINRFGPNIMLNLDKVNLSYDEAKEIIKKELTCNRLIGINVHAKAFQIVTPKKIQQAYTVYLEKNPAKERYVYQVLSIRGDDKASVDALGTEARTLIDRLPAASNLETIQTALTNDNPGIAVSVSQTFEKELKDLSSQYKTILTSMDSEGFSQPASQFSRHTKSHVCRIFHLLKTETQKPASFNAMHDSLKNDLLNQVCEEEKKHYDEKLEKKFGFYKESSKFTLPQQYHPFFLL